MSAKTLRKKPEPTAAADAFVVIGRVGKPHGLRGAFFVSGREDAVAASYGELRIGATLASAVPTRIESSAMQAGRPLLKCTLAGDRTSAGLLTGALIFAPKTKIEQRRAGETLWSDLAGAEVLGRDGELIGRVHHVYNAGSSDIVEVRSGERSVDIPLVEAYIGGSGGARKNANGTFTLLLSVPAAVFAEVWNDQTDQADQTKLPGDSDA